MKYFTEKGQKRHTFAKYASLRRRKPRLNFYEGNFLSVTTFLLVSYFLLTQFTRKLAWSSYHALQTHNKHMPRHTFLLRVSLIYNWMCGYIKWINATCQCNCPRTFSMTKKKKNDWTLCERVIIFRVNALFINTTIKEPWMINMSIFYTS